MSSINGPVSAATTTPGPSPKKRLNTWLPRLTPRGVLSEDVSDILKVGTLVSLFVQLPNLTLVSLLGTLFDTLAGRTIPADVSPLIDLLEVLALTAPLALSVAIAGLILIFRTKRNQDTVALAAVMLLFGMALGSRLVGAWGTLAPGILLGEPGRYYPPPLALFFAVVNTLFGYYLVFTFWPFLHAIVVGLFLTWAVVKIRPSITPPVVFEHIAKLDEHGRWKRVITIALLIPTVLFATSSMDDPWRVIAPSGGCYSIQMPGVAPSATPKSFTDPSGFVRVGLGSASKTTAYMVEYIDLSVITRQRRPQELLESTLRVYSEAITATAQLTQTIVAAGKPGLSAELSMPDGKHRWFQAVLFDTRLYVLTVTASPGTESKADPEKFFTSFRLTCQVAPPAPTVVATPGWQKTVSTEGSFSIETPGLFNLQPIVIDRDSQTTGHGAQITQGETAYEFTYWDDAAPHPEDYLNNLVDGIVQVCDMEGGDTPVVTRIKIQGFPSVRVQCHTGAGGYMRFQGVVVEQRTYLMDVITPDEVISADEIERYFNSFTLLNP